jgi:repressor LexA
MPPGSPSAGKLIRQARQACGLTLDTLAERIGCSKPQLSLMENGRRTVTAQRAAQIEQVLGITDQSIVRATQWDQVPAELRQRMSATEQLRHQLQQALGSDDPAGSLRSVLTQHGGNVDEPMPLSRQIPVINKVAAGYPTQFTDLDYPPSVADEYIACPDINDPTAFAARVVGDSMEPDYREGEIVVFSPQLPTPDGSDCFVRLEPDHDTTFKRIYTAEDGDLIRLQPINPVYEPSVLPREQVSGIYRAAFVMRRVGG